MTFGGVGQGVESQHDVWRQMAYRALDGIRIREVNLTGGTCPHRRRSRRGLPATAGVTTFTRGFEWNGAVVDHRDRHRDAGQALAAGVAPAVRHGVHRPGHDVRQRPRRRTVASRVVRIAGPSRSRRAAPASRPLARRARSRRASKNHADTRSPRRRRR